MAITNQGLSGGLAGRLRTLLRRKPLVYALVLALGALILIGSLRQGTTGIAGFDPVEDVLRMLSDRSPGERTKAELRNSKSKHTPARLHKPRVERVLGKVFPPEIPAPPTPLLGLNGPLFGPIEFPAGNVPLGGVSDNTPGSYLPTPFSGGGIGGGGGPGGGGPGGGGPGGGGTSPPPVIIPAEVSAVPEPGTWLTMFLGMSLCGAALRRRKRYVVRDADVSHAN